MASVNAGAPSWVRRTVHRGRVERVALVEGAPVPSSAPSGLAAHRLEHERHSVLGRLQRMNLDHAGDVELTEDLVIVPELRGVGRRDGSLCLGSFRTTGVPSRVEAGAQSPSVRCAVGIEFRHEGSVGLTIPEM
jgi:hypothetical protein